MSNDRTKKERLIDSPIRNIMHSLYDLYVEANVRHRQQSGISTVIIRRQVGKCCDWCARLAGIFDYDSAPADIYKRHDNCKCQVTFKSEKGHYVDVWSRIEYDSARSARRGRVDEIVNKGNALDELHRLKNEARSRGEHCVDATEYWLKTKMANGEVKERDFFLHNGQRLNVDGKHVVFEPSQEERQTAELLAKTFGGTVEMIPRIEQPKCINAPDYVFNGMKFDRKGPKGSGKRTIKNNIMDAKKQANNVVLDLSICGLDDSRVFQDINRVYGSEDFRDLKTIIVTKNNRVIKVFERT